MVLELTMAPTTQQVIQHATMADPRGLTGGSMLLNCAVWAMWVALKAPNSGASRPLQHHM